MDFRENTSRSKEVLSAYWRQGLSELASLTYGPGTAAQPPEYGMLGTKPPSMVVEGLKGEHDPQARRKDAEPSQLDQYMQRAQEREAPEPEREDRSIERE